MSVEELCWAEYMEENGQEWLKEKRRFLQRKAMIADLTIGQRNNPFLSGHWSEDCAWWRHILHHSIRKLWVTNQPKKKRLLSAYNLQEVAPIVWGITHKRDALEQYKALGASVQDSGIWLHPSVWGFRSEMTLQCQGKTQGCISHWILVIPAHKNGTGLM